MPNRKENIIVIIPAYNEEAAIGKVIDEIPEIVDTIIVVDNNSTDNTAEVAQRADKRVQVVPEPKMGYGQACLTGLARARDLDPAIICFIDGDYSDYPAEMTDVLQPILEEKLDMVIGSRTLGKASKGALLPQARFGNWLAGLLIRIFYGFRYSDLGPFRAVRWRALETINMQDTSFGWTVEMQVKAVKAKLRIGEVSVSYKPRIGKSKITGTLKGTVLAGYYIITTIFRYIFWKPRK